MGKYRINAALTKYGKSAGFTVSKNECLLNFVNHFTEMSDEMLGEMQEELRPTRRRDVACNVSTTTIPTNCHHWYWQLTILLARKPKLTIRSIISTIRKPKRHIRKGFLYFCMPMLTFRSRINWGGRFSVHFSVVK
jgi:hypothetical protein